MRRKDELTKVNEFFKQHPDQVKYDRKISGFKSSYIKDPAGNIIRSGNKSEPEHELGKGGYGRVKRSESNGQASAMKIQKYTLEGFEVVREDIEREAQISLDTGFARGPMAIKIDEEKGVVKCYQEMYIMQDSLKSRISNFTQDQKIYAAIDLLLLVNDLHTGVASKSGKFYAHGDISAENVMYDLAGQMRLIDYGHSEELDYINQLDADNKFMLSTLYNETGLSLPIFNQEDFQQFPPHLREILNKENRNNLGVEKEDLLIFIAAALIAYQQNPQLSENDIHMLKSNPKQQMLLVQQHKRLQEISQIPDDKAQKSLEKITIKLTRFSEFLDNQIKKAQRDNNDSNYEIYVAKKIIVSEMLMNIHTKLGETSSQQILIQFDKDLMQNRSILSQESPISSPGVLGRLGAKIHNYRGNISLSSLEQDIDEHLNKDKSAIYHATVEEVAESIRRSPDSITIDFDDNHRFSP